MDHVKEEKQLKTSKSHGRTKRTITLAAAETDNGNVQNMISLAPMELSECIVSYIIHQQILSYVLTHHPITDAVGLHALSLIHI